MDYTNSFDIAPGEERRILIDVVVGFSTDPGSEGEPIIEQRYINRSSNSRFYEPLDLSDQPHNASQWATSNNRAEHQKFHSERERLKTFDLVWKPEYNVSKEDLAREGFIYKGPDDLVMCVFCLKSIRKWDRGDSVQGEHKRLYPMCPWVREKVHHMNIPISKQVSMQRDMRVTGKGLPQVSDMIAADARMKTFEGWIKRDNVSVEALVNAGFFYDSSSDIVTCFHCGTKILGCNLKDHAVHHASSSPNCPRVQPDHSGQNMPPVANMEVQLADHPGQENGDMHVEGAEAMANMDDDMQSPAVQAIVSSYGDEYNMEDIRTAVQSLRISKGSGHITSGEILMKLDPDLDI